MSESKSTGVQDQRRAERDDLEAPVRIHLEGGLVRGMSENLSELGLLLFTEDALRCSVEIGEGENVRRRGGRIVRVQRMNETNTGLAIEFDED